MRACMLLARTNSNVRYFVFSSTDLAADCGVLVPLWPPCTLLAADPCWLWKLVAPLSFSDMPSGGVT